MDLKEENKQMNGSHGLAGTAYCMNDAKEVGETEKYGSARKISMALVVG